MYYCDYHIHTGYSFDAKEKPTIEDYCRRAMELNLAEICITDHYDLGAPTLKDDHLDFEGNLNSIERAQEKFPKLIIKKGIEAGLIPETIERVADKTDFYNYDYVLASQHVIDGVDVFLNPEFFDMGRDKAYYRCLEALYETLKVYKNWCCIGHIGYFTRFYDSPDNRLKYSDGADIIDEMLKYTINLGRGIEINTGGIAKTGDTLPPIDIIKRYLELKGEIITVGSDAHSISGLFENILQTQETLKHLGAKYIAAYSKRKPVFHKL